MPTIDLPRADARKTARSLSLLTATALAGGILAAPAAEAQPAWNAMPVTGLYIGAGAGVNFLQETDLNQSGTLTAGLRAAGFPAPSGNATFDVGFATVGSVGWGFGNGLRAELELSYRWNEVDNITGFGRLGPRLTTAGGEQQAIGVMANLLYDFEIPGSPWVVPYVGAGVGMVWTKWSSTRARSIPADLQLT